jgi:16S rRNA (adenine1518-N6/adenine1519-N6)-dimethyltransferase
MNASLPPISISNLLNKYGLRPKKGLGQNFLSDPGVLQKVVRAGGVTSTDTILEIGPGLGSLTRYLAAAAREVVVVEIDHAMLGPLGEVLAPFDNVRVVHGDILALPPQEWLPAGPYSVVANIPYYITSALIRMLLESSNPPERLALTVQKEVAERICSSPPRMSLLALSVQVYGEPQIAARIPAGAFFPPPKVDSAVVRLDRYADPLIGERYLDAFFQLARAGFQQKRKTLRNALAAGLGWKKPDMAELLTAAGIDPDRRAQTLTLREWGELSRQYVDGGRPAV